MSGAIAPPYWGLQLSRRLVRCVTSAVSDVPRVHDVTVRHRVCKHSLWHYEIDSHPPLPSIPLFFLRVRGASHAPRPVGPPMVSGAFGGIQYTDCRLDTHTHTLSLSLSLSLSVWNSDAGSENSWTPVGKASHSGISISSCPLNPTPRTRKPLGPGLDNVYRILQLLGKQTLPDWFEEAASFFAGKTKP